VWFYGVKKAIFDVKSGTIGKYFLARLLKYTNGPLGFGWCLIAVVNKLKLLEFCAKYGF